MPKQQKQRESIQRTSIFPLFSQLRSHPRAGMIIGLAYGVVMLFINLTYHVVGDYHVETDFFWSYVPMAKTFLSGEFPIEDFHGPAYPMLLALIGAFTKDFFHAGVVLSTAAAALTLFFVFEILKRLFRPDIALVGSLLVAVNTTFVQYSYTAGTDMVFNALVTGSLFVFLKADERRWMNIIVAALLSAIAYLARYNGVYVLPAAIAIYFVNPFNLNGRDRMKTAAVFLGVFFLAISPWGVYCLVEKGSFFYSKNYLNIAYEMFAKGRMGWDQYWNVEAHKFHSLAHVVFSDPGRFVQTILSNIIEHFTNDLGNLVGWPVGVFSLVGIYFFIREKPTAQQLSFFIFAAFFFGVLLLVFYGERFSMFLLPVYIALALRALTHPALAKYRLWNRVQIGSVIALALLFWTANESYAYNKVNIDSGPKEVLAISDWFKRNVQPSTTEEVIVARKPHIAYYLGMKMESFPYVNTLEELLTQSRNAHARYLFFSLMEAGMRPQFQYLLDWRKAPPQLKPLTYTLSPPAVLYEILEQDQP